MMLSTSSCVLTSHFYILSTELFSSFHSQWFFFPVVLWFLEYSIYSGYSPLVRWVTVRISSQWMHFSNGLRSLDSTHFISSSHGSFLHVCSYVCVHVEVLSSVIFSITFWGRILVNLLLADLARLASRISPRDVPIPASPWLRFQMSTTIPSALHGI